MALAAKLEQKKSDPPKEASATPPAKPAEAKTAEAKPPEAKPPEAKPAAAGNKDASLAPKKTLAPTAMSA
jgi:hypothetical protein